MTLSKTSLSLSDSQINEQFTLRLELTNHSNFDISLRSSNTFSTAQDNLFYLEPEDRRADGDVSIAIAIPFHEDVTDSFRNSGSPNRVKNNYRHNASSSFSLCPSPERFDSSITVCKPVQIQIIDDETAIPGIIYSTDIEFVIETDDGQHYSETINISYRKTGSTLGIVARKNSLNLNSHSDYRDFVDLCVFSYIATEFELMLESVPSSSDKFLLQGEKNQTLEYKADVSVKNRSSQIKAKNNQWMDGGYPLKARVDSRCNGKNNVTLDLYIEREAIAQAEPGTYNGILTVRVKAK